MRYLDRIEHKKKKKEKIKGNSLTSIWIVWKDGRLAGFCAQQKEMSDARDIGQSGGMSGRRFSMPTFIAICIGCESFQGTAPVT